MLLLLSCAACTTGSELSEEEPSRLIPVPESLPVEPTAPVSPDNPDVRSADGSPSWCADVIGPAVQQLPSALDRLGESESAAAVAESLTAAADELATLSSVVPDDVQAAADEVQSALRLVASDSLDPEALTALADAFSRLNQQTQPVCEYSE